MNIENKIKALVAIVGMIGLFISVFQFLKVQTVAAQKPYLEKKLYWCEEAVETAARIATTREPQDADVVRFRQLYWGVMAMIEKDEILSAMVEFDNLLLDPEEKSSSSSDALPQSTKDAGTRQKPETLTDASINIAHACRHELSSEWSPIWSR